MNLHNIFLQIVSGCHLAWFLSPATSWPQCVKARKSDRLPKTVLTVDWHGMQLLCFYLPVRLLLRRHCGQALDMT